MGQQVMPWNQRQGVPWVAGIIVETQSIELPVVQVDTEQLWKHRLDHLRIGAWDSQQQDSEWNFAVSPEQLPTSSETCGRSDTSVTSTVIQPVNHYDP